MCVAAHGNFDGGRAPARARARVRAHARARGREGGRARAQAHARAGAAARGAAPPRAPTLSDGARARPSAPCNPLQITPDTPTSPRLARPGPPGARANHPPQMVIMFLLGAAATLGAVASIYASVLHLVDSCHRRAPRVAPGGSHPQSAGGRGLGAGARGSGRQQMGLQHPFPFLRNRGGARLPSHHRTSQPVLTRPPRPALPPLPPHPCPPSPRLRGDRLIPKAKGGGMLAWLGTRLRSVRTRAAAGTACRCLGHNWLWRLPVPAFDAAPPRSPPAPPFSESVQAWRACCCCWTGARGHGYEPLLAGDDGSGRGRRGGSSSSGGGGGSGAARQRSGLSGAAPPPQAASRP